MLRIEKMDDFARNRKFPPSFAQWQAISVVGADVLVAAAAGSGKTEVLSERIARKVACSRWDIDRMLVLTFTTAAAKNMLVRIEGKISERLLATNLEEDRIFLRKQNMLMNNANVSTIDSFCLSVLRKFYYLVEEEIDGDIKYLAPNFSILPNSKNLLIEAIREVLEEYFYYEKKALDTLFNMFGTREKIIDSIIDVYYKLLSIPNFEEYLEREFLKNNTELLSYFLLESFSEVASFGKLKALTTKDEIECAKKFSLFLKESLRENEENFIFKVLSESELDKDKKEKLRKIFSDDEDNIYASSLEQSEHIESIVKALEKELAKMDNVFDAEKLSLIYQELQSYYNNFYFANELNEFANCYKNILIAIHKRFIKKKRVNNFLDFSDLNHLAIKALEEKKDGKKVPSIAAQYYREHFLEIYVDEYQDNNNLQEYILNLIKGDNVNFFRVGDVKQAIYGFRGSNPDLFEKKYNSYEKLVIEDYDINKEYEIPFSGEGICVVLKENYRSDENVLKSSNYVFDKLMANKNAGVSYNKESALYYPESKRKNDEEDKKIIATKLLSGEVNYFTHENVDKNEYKTQAIENIVFEILKGVKEGNNYSDYAILVRNSTKMENYKKIFKKYNIPLFFKEKVGFTESNTFNILYNIFRFLDNSTRNISLAAILHSEIFDYSNDDLLRLSLNSGDTLFEKLKNSIFEKDKDTVNLLNKWLNYSLNNSLSSLLEKVANDLDFVNYLVTVDISDEEVDYYENFVSVVTDYEVLDNKLSSFVEHLESIKEDPKFETKKKTPNNSVTLSTIHISKGLEYKYVFVADLDTEFSKKGTEGLVLFTSEFGFSIASEKFALAYEMINQNVNYFEKLHNLNSAIIKFREREEEIRNLYVALTRAEKVLYLVSPNGIKLNQESDYGEDLSSAILEAKNFENILNIVFSTYDFDTEDAKFEEYELDEVEDFEMEDESTFSLDEFYNSFSKKNKAEEIIKKEIVKNKIFPAKTSYSALKKINKETATTKKENKKTFLQLSTLSKTSSTSDALLRGNVVHKLFERIVTDIKNEEEISDVEKYIHSLVKVEDTLENIRSRKILTLREYNVINKKEELECIKEFLNSELIDLVRNNKCQTEVAFTTAKSASELYTKSTSSTEVILQGVVDLLIEVDEKEAIIVDYKTDKVRGKNPEKELIQRHKEQLKIYKEAVATYYYKESVKMYIYSYRLAKLIEVED